MVKILCMVKNEVDIVRSWVKYHASLVGLKNLVVLDNQSTDGTKEALMQSGVTVISVPDYRLKGQYMTDLARNSPTEMVIPLDIDEFMVVYDKKTNTISCNVLSVLATLPTVPVYKMNYIEVKSLGEYNTAPAQATHGRYLDYASFAKSFFHMKEFKGTIDHGNHFQTPYYIQTTICLVHYHYRNKNQYFEKIKCNLEGFKYPLNDVVELKRLLSVRCQGNHHVRSQIAILEGTFSRPRDEIAPDDIDLTPLMRKILSL
jgi:hypothetical protein